MVQLVYPTNSLAPRARTHSIRCTPLTRRRTLPTLRDLTFSQSWRQNAIERAAIRKLADELGSQASPLPKLTGTLSLPIILPVTAVSAIPGISIQAIDNQPKEIPGTPATPLESQEYYPEPESQREPEPKANIFDTNTKSDVLVDLIMAALYRIYIDDFSQDGPSSDKQESQLFAALQAPPNWATLRTPLDCYDQSPPSTCGSSVSSASSTPSALSTPQSFSPAIDPEIAYMHQATDTGRFIPNKAYTASPAAAVIAKPVTRAHSAMPVHARRTEAPTLGDKKNLRWFLVELLRRSRSSASVVQLALHYLGQAREPVGDILHRRFKASTRQADGCAQGQDKIEDSPLLDPRRLLLAALMLSTKLLHDHAPNNRAWSRVCGLPTHEVGACERGLCQALNWNLANMFVGPRDDRMVIV